MVKSVDTSQLSSHVMQLNMAPVTALTAVEAATRLSSQRIQSLARDTYGGTRHWQHVPRDITYDVQRKGTDIQAEIGRKSGIGGQSALMHLLEYGSSRFGPIKPALGPALDATVEVHEKAVRAAATAVLGAGIGRMGRLSR